MRLCAICGDGFTPSKKEETPEKLCDRCSILCHAFDTAKAKNPDGVKQWLNDEGWKPIEAQSAVPFLQPEHTLSLEEESKRLDSQAEAAFIGRVPRVWIPRELAIAMCNVMHSAHEIILLALKIKAHGERDAPNGLTDPKAETFGPGASRPGLPAWRPEASEVCELLDEAAKLEAFNSILKAEYDAIPKRQRANIRRANQPPSRPEIDRAAAKERAVRMFDSSAPGGIVDVKDTSTAKPLEPMGAAVEVFKGKITGVALVDRCPQCGEKFDEDGYVNGVPCYHPTKVKLDMTSPVEAGPSPEVRLLAASADVVRTLERQISKLEERIDPVSGHFRALRHELVNMRRDTADALSAMMPILELTGSHVEAVQRFSQPKALETKLNEVREAIRKLRGA